VEPGRSRPAWGISVSVCIATAAWVRINRRPVRRRGLGCWPSHAPASNASTIFHSSPIRLNVQVTVFSVACDCLLALSPSAGERTPPKIRTGTVPASPLISTGPAASQPNAACAAEMFCAFPARNRSLNGAGIPARSPRPASWATPLVSGSTVDDPPQPTPQAIAVKMELRLSKERLSRQAIFPLGGQLRRCRHRRAQSLSGDSVCLPPAIRSRLPVPRWCSAAARLRSSQRDQ